MLVNEKEIEKGEIQMKTYKEYGKLEGYVNGEGERERKGNFL